MNKNEADNLEWHIVSAVPGRKLKVILRQLIRTILHSPLSLFFVLGIHWIFQGLLNMDRTERYFKISIDIIISIIIFLAMQILWDYYITIPVSFIMAHTLNFLFYGQIPVNLLHFGVRRYEKKSVLLYVDGLKQRVSKRKCILAVGIWGGISRGEVEDYPDVDLRVFRKTGFINGIKACYTMMTERTRALFKGFPLDAFLSDSWKHIERLRPDEVPVLLYDPACFIKERYAPAKEWSTVYNTKNKKDTL